MPAATNGKMTASSERSSGPASIPLRKNPTRDGRRIPLIAKRAMGGDPSVEGS
jgi:hypothetical protein